VHSVSSISRKNCYIVSAGDLQNRYSTHEESGKRMTPGLLIGCHVDTSTGLVTFTVNGQEAANKFQVRAQCAVKGVSRMDFFIGECKTEGSKTESGGGVPGKGKQPPPHQLGGLEERCELRSPDHPTVIQYDYLSPLPFPRDLNE